MNPKYEEFPITSLSRADLESVGCDATSVDDTTMNELADKVADDYCDQLFWRSLEILARHLNILKPRPQKPRES